MHESHLELAANTDESQLLGVDTVGGGGSLGEEILNEGVFADGHQLLQTGMKGIVVLVQEANLGYAVRETVGLQNTKAIIT